MVISRDDVINRAVVCINLSERPSGVLVTTLVCVHSSISEILQTILCSVVGDDDMLVTHRIKTDGHCTAPICCDTGLRTPAITLSKVSFSTYVVEQICARRYGTCRPTLGTCPQPDHRGHCREKKFDFSHVYNVL